MLIFTLLQGVDALHGLLVRGIAADAPHRIGGIEDQAAGAKYLYRFVHRGRKRRIGLVLLPILSSILLSHSLLFR